MKVGFTGTRSGLTAAQRIQVGILMRLMQARDPVTAFHHGDCTGADEQAALIARAVEWHVVAHPCNLEDQRARSPANDETRAPKDPLVRNHDIVDEVDEMIATPSGSVEQLRSGTWATIRYARKSQRPLWLIFPDGTIKVETASSAV